MDLKSVNFPIRFSEEGYIPCVARRDGDKLLVFFRTQHFFITEQHVMVL